MGKVAITLKTSARVETSLFVSHTLIQSLEILSLPIDQLEIAIKQKLDENPALSIVTHGKKEKRLHNHLSVENRFANQPTLYDILTQQVRDVFTKNELPIAMMIAGNITEKGFLGVEIAELATLCNVAQNEVQRILSRFQLLDPIGIGAMNPREALLIQAKEKKLSCAIVILENHYDQLLHGKYREIAAALKIAPEKLKEIINLEIKILTPFPGYGFNTLPVLTRRTELQLDLEKDGWVVTHFDEDLPLLEISQEFMTSNESWRIEKVEEANRFIETIAKRKSLLIKAVMILAKKQCSYLQGASNMLEPLLICEMAKELEVAPSTLSRALSNKVIDTPRGIVSLRELFTQKIDTKNQKSISKQKAKMLLKQLIENENRKKPVRDDSLVELLKQQHDVELSRRTIAKYRAELGIPTASLRDEKRY